MDHHRPTLSVYLGFPLRCRILGKMRWLVMSYFQNHTDAKHVHRKYCCNYIIINIDIFVYTKTAAGSEVFYLAVEDDADFCLVKRILGKGALTWKTKGATISKLNSCSTFTFGRRQKTRESFPALVHLWQGRCASERCQVAATWRQWHLNIMRRYALPKLYPLRFLQG